jgi:hypothetical protein
MESSNDIDEELAAMAATLAEDPMNGDVYDDVEVGIGIDEATAVADVFSVSASASSSSRAVPPVPTTTTTTIFTTTDTSSTPMLSSGSVHPLTVQTQLGIVEPPPKRIKLEVINKSAMNPPTDDMQVEQQRVSTHISIQPTAATPVVATTSHLYHQQQQPQQQLHCDTLPPPTLSMISPNDNSHPECTTGEVAVATATATTTNSSIGSSSKVPLQQYGGSSVVTAGTTDGSHQEMCQSFTSSSHDSLTDATTLMSPNVAAASSSSSSHPAACMNSTTTTTSIPPPGSQEATRPNSHAMSLTAPHPTTSPGPTTTTTTSTASTTTGGVGPTTVSSTPVVVTSCETVGTTTTTIPNAASMESSSCNNQGGMMVVSNPIAPTVLEVSAPTASATATTAENAIPLKSVNYGHLRVKYLGELEYMVREFRKLERQLLGAKGAAQLEESAGSRERREKLHSFILHLEDTIRQIEVGCKVESSSSSGEGVTSSSIAESNGGGTTTTKLHDEITSSQQQQQQEQQQSSSCDTSSSAAAPGGEGTATAPASSDLSQAKRGQMAEESALANLTKEKEEEENVQKLEEHILANLLPVKVRLKKQLAAQQGATQNPAGMPALRRGSLQPPSATRGKGTFAEAAEKRRKQAEAARLAAQEQHERAVRRVSDPTQFGKPLSGGGSSLTQKLHGPTLGSTERVHGHGVGTTAASVMSSSDGGSSAHDGKPVIASRKILYAGMVPGSDQIESGLSAASGAHEIADVTTTTIQTGSSGSNEYTTLKVADPDPTPVTTTTTGTLPAATPTPPKTVNYKVTAAVNVQPKPVVAMKAQTPAILDTESKAKFLSSSSPSAALDGIETKDSGIESVMTEDERRMMKKLRRKRKLLRLARRQERERLKQQVRVPQQPPTIQLPPKPAVGRKKAASGKSQKKKGPRSVEYICALCSEAYTSTCDYNPWWALAQHDCPKCRKNQVSQFLFMNRVS